MNKAKNGTVKVGQTVRLCHPEDSNIYEDFIVAAVNATIPANNVKVIPVKSLFALRSVTASELLIHPEDAPAAEQIKAQKEKDAANSSAGNDPEKLREDGPSLEQYIKQGYDAAGYPPKGYAARNSPGWQKLKKEREDFAKKQADEEAAKKLAEEAAKA